MKIRFTLLSNQFVLDNYDFIFEYFCVFIIFCILFYYYLYLYWHSLKKVPIFIAIYIYSLLLFFLEFLVSELDVEQPDVAKRQVEFPVLQRPDDVRRQFELRRFPEPVRRRGIAQSWSRRETRLRQTDGDAIVS